MAIKKNFIRRVILPVAYQFGLGKMLRNSTAHKSLILMYHGVSKGNYAHINGRHLPVKQFEQHLIYLKKNFTVVTLAEIFDLYSQKKEFNYGRKVVAITFDDGFVNNLECALPLLEKYEMPATFFVTSHVLSGLDIPIWADAIDIMLYQIKDTTIRLGDKEFLRTDRVNIYNYIKSQNTQSRPLILDEFYTKYDLNTCLNNVSYEVWKTVNKEQLQKLASSKFAEIGNHTYLHYNLANLSSEEAEYEIGYSKKEIENAIQKEVKSIAFPDGSYNESVKKISLKLGLSRLLAVDYRLNEDITDKNILPRWGIACSTTYESNILQINRAFKNYGFM